MQRHFLVIFNDSLSIVHCYTSIKSCDCYLVWGSCTFRSNIPDKYLLGCKRTEEGNIMKGSKGDTFLKKLRIK